MKIETKDSNGKPNGWVYPIWNVNDNPELRPDQVYVTAIAPHTRKGPHLHMRRRGLFFVIAGEVTLIRRNGSVIWEARKTAGSSYSSVPPGVACALYNYGDTEALVINMPSPAWSAEDSDEHPVEDWQDPEDWPA